MEPPPTISEPASAPPSRRRLLVPRLIVVGLGLLALTVAILLLAANRPVSNQVTWLTPQEMARLTQPGPLTRLKYKLMNLTEPLWRHFQSNRPSIDITSNLLELSPAAAQQTGLGPPIATNTQGLRAWILPPAALKDFKQHLRTLPGVTHLSSPRIQTGDDTQAQLSSGNSIPVGGTNTWVGLSINLTPHLLHNSIRLTLGVNSTELANSSSKDPPSIRTNIALACQTVLPNAHGLVLDGGNGNWFILSPTLIDARGKPINP